MNTFTRIVFIPLVSAFVMCQISMLSQAVGYVPNCAVPQTVEIDSSYTVVETNHTFMASSVEDGSECGIHVSRLAYKMTEPPSREIVNGKWHVVLDVCMLYRDQVYGFQANNGSYHLAVNFRSQLKFPHLTFGIELPELPFLHPELPGQNSSYYKKFQANFFRQDKSGVYNIDLCGPK